MTEIEELRDALERARTWAIALEGELFGLRETIRNERKYCESVAESFENIDETTRVMWDHAAARLECVERVYSENFQS